MDAKEAAVWPDGNEKSRGLATRSEMAVFTSKGRVLATKFLRMPLHKITSTKSAAMRTSPALRVLGMRSRTRVKRIQRIPASPSFVKLDMNASKNGVCSVWIQSKMPSSIAVMIKSPCVFDISILYVKICHCQ